MTPDLVDFATGLLRVEAVRAHDDVVPAVFAAPIDIRLRQHPLDCEAPVADDLPGQLIGG